MLNLNSQRGLFAQCLMFEMERDPNIRLFTADLGYGVLTHVMDKYPDRVTNTGAAEQCMMDIAIGATLAGFRVFVYSITPFLIYRPFESIRTYINKEVIPVQLVGSGRDTDYAHDGYSHDACDDEEIMKTQKNITFYKPKDIADLPKIVSRMAISPTPSYLNLSR